MASQSMPRFAGMLQSAFEARGHTVTAWTPKDAFHRRFEHTRLAKWAGYLDQYWLFPRWVRRRVAVTPPGTLFVFCDQALGPWMPLMRDRPHVVHAHDLLALRSALGDIPENPTRFTGRVYQRYIRRGFRQARHFISVSRKTRDDLHLFGGIEPRTSVVVHNGLSFPFRPIEGAAADLLLRAAGLPAAPHGLLLHVGGDQWYKNRRGVVSLYARYAAEAVDPLPLWCVGPAPDAALAAAVRDVPGNGRVLFFQGIDNPTLRALYCRSRAMLFPSLAEGFGWPLIEAQACGCPVITTREPPMDEVAGETAVYLRRLRHGESLDRWARDGAKILRRLLDESQIERERRADRGRAWAKRFDAEVAIEAYLAIYAEVLQKEANGTD